MTIFDLRIEENKITKEPEFVAYRNGIMIATINVHSVGNQDVIAVTSRHIISLSKNSANARYPDGTVKLVEQYVMKLKS